MLLVGLRLGAYLLQEFFKWEWLYYVGIILLVLFLISLCDELNDRFKRIPFGPMRLPIYGNRFQLWIYGGKRPYTAITRMAKSYREGFMKIFFGLTGYVSVNGYQRLAETLDDESDWIGERDEVWRLDRTDEEKKSTADLAVWVSRRNIAIRCLQNTLLARKDALNGLIGKQVADLLIAVENQERIDKLGNRDITSDTFIPYVISSVWSVLTGDDHMEVTDRRVQTVHRCLKDWEENTISLNGWADYYPFLVRWLPSWVGYSKLQEVNHDFRKVLKCLIKEQYKKAVKNRLNPESYVQACVREFKELRQNSFGADQMNDSSSIALLFEFLCPGPLIASSYIGFCLQFAARDPTAQDRIVNEIRALFGTNIIPTFDKMDRMPYTSAFILETYRISSIVPVERRKLLKLLRLGDTRFPREMPMLLNYHSANMDPSVWPDPVQFKPERFLNPKEDKVVNEEKLVTLVAEKHLCAGQPLLKMIIFSCFTGFLQKWRLELWPNWVDKGPEYGILNKPQPMRVKLRPRLS